MLPTLHHNADGKGYRLRLHSGQYLNFDTLEQAQEALWAEPEARAIANNRYLREIINNDLATLLPGQNRKTIVSRELVHAYNRLQQMPDGPAKDALRAQLAEREALADQHDGPLDESQAYDEQAALIDATTPDPTHRRAARAIIGESYEEFIDGVYVSVSRLNRGATPLTLVEENLEHDARRILAQPGGRDSLLEAFRDTEAKLGDKLLLTDDNAQVSDQQLIETFSRLGVDLFVGESRAGNARFKENRRWLDHQARRILRSTRLGQMLDAFAAKMAAVFRRAEKLGLLRQEGRFHAGLEAQLAQALGLSPRAAQAAIARVEARTAAEAEASYSLGPIDNTNETHDTLTHEQRQRIQEKLPALQATFDQLGDFGGASSEQLAQIRFFVSFRGILTRLEACRARRGRTECVCGSCRSCESPVPTP